jgi:hypothetical protein
MNPIAISVKTELALPENVRLTPTGLEVLGRLTYSQWVDTCKAASVIESAGQWAIGDAYNSVNRADKRSFCNDVGCNHSTARVYARVAATFPSVRRLTLSIGHHQVVMALEEPKRSELLAQALDSNWSVQTLKSAVRDYRDSLVVSVQPPSDKSPEQQAHESNLKLFGSLDSSEDESPVEASPTTDIFGDSPKESTSEPSVDSDLPQGIPEPSESQNTPVAEAHRVSLSIGSEFEMESFAEDLADSVLVQAATEEEVLSPEDMPAVTDWESGEGTEWHKQYPFYSTCENATAEGLVFGPESSKDHTGQCEDFTVLLKAVLLNIETYPFGYGCPKEMVDALNDIDKVLITFMGDLLRNNHASKSLKKIA